MLLDQLSFSHFDQLHNIHNCMNCSSLSAGKRTRNPFKSPFRSATDWKLKVHTHKVCNVDITSATTHTVVVEGGIPTIP